MKKILIIFMVLCISLVACSSNMPDGIDNKMFYQDMTSVLQEIRDNFKKTQKLEFESETFKKVLKYFKEDELWKDKERKNLNDWLYAHIKDGLNEKEKMILQHSFIVLSTYNDYIEYQQKNSVREVKDLELDLENPFSNKLKFGLNVFIKELGVNYIVK